jgi:hypothetical protein
MPRLPLVPRRDTTRHDLDVGGRRLGVEVEVRTLGLGRDVRFEVGRVRASRVVSERDDARVEVVIPPGEEHWARVAGGLLVLWVACALVLRVARAR